MSGLYQTHRPTDFDQVIGQADAVRVLRAKCDKGNVPHAILFSGPSGCGKTTLARIVQARLKCSKMDFVALNSGDVGGVDTIREIRTRMFTAPMSGKCRIWLIDEAHQLTKPAQNAFLDMLEDTPNHVYFMLCTTDPGKLVRAIHTRCTEIKVKPVKPADMKKLILNVANTECTAGWSLHAETLVKIIEVAEGSPRKALVLLESILEITDAEEQLETVQKADTERQSIELCRVLLNAHSTWPETAAILATLDDEPERIRRLVLSYATSVLLRAGPQSYRASLVIQAFRDDFFASGKAGLVAASYEVFADKTK